MTEEDTRYRSLSAAGMGAGAATEAVLGVLEARKGLVVHVIAPGRIAVARTSRPRWAVIACLCTVWLGGLGLLFLLVKQTEAGEITLGDGPQGCVVIVPPMLRGSVTEELAVVLGGPIPASGRHDSEAFGPSTAVSAVSAGVDDLDDLDERTVARTELLPPPPLPQPAAGPVTMPVAVEPQVTLHFPAGVVVVEAGTAVVLGRDPSAAGGAQARVVPGDASTVSKSHLLVSFDGTALSVEDLGSTNGSALVRDGHDVVLEPGVGASAVSGDRVRIGVLEFVIEHGDQE